MKSLVCLILTVSPLLITANVWDNLFLGQGIDFKFPQEFKMVLSAKHLIGVAELEIIGSTKLNSLMVTQNMAISSLVSITSPGQINFLWNFAQGTMIANSKLKSCIKVQDPQLERDYFGILPEIINVLTLLLSRTKDGRFYKLKLNDLSQMVLTKNISFLKASINLENIPDIAFFFDSRTKELKKIQIKESGQTVVLDVIEFAERESRPEDFSIPEEWKCQEETFKQINELDLKEMFGGLKENSAALSNLLKFLPFDLSKFDLDKIDLSG